MNVPYTYLIGWTSENLWYYGVRFSRSCHPKDLWVTYFTSSKYVQKTRKILGEPDVIEVRRTFSTPCAARFWEAKVIQRMGAVQHAKWLNRSDNNHQFFFEGPRGEFSPEHRAKLSEAAKKRKLSDKHKQALHNGRRGTKNTPEHNAAILAASLGRKRSAEEREKHREIRLNNPNRFAISSQGGKAAAAKRSGDENYKKQQSEKMKQIWAERKRLKAIIQAEEN